MRPQTKTGLFMGCGSVLVVLGAVMVVFWPPIFLSQLQRMMTLTPTSASFDIWRETPIPMYLECFLFNITNADEIIAGKNVSIRVEQLGPYVYKESHSKANISWHDNSTVEFYNLRYWHFEPEMSNGSLSDEIVSINPIIVTMSYLFRHNTPLVNVAFDVFMKMFHEHMFLRANVSSWLFDGIYDPVLDFTAHFPDMPFNIPYDKFGWFYERNGSIEYDGSFLMNTGEAEFRDLGNLEKWRFSNRTMYRDECGEVKGSTGELWAPEFGQPNVTIFAPDICTYMTLPIDKTVVVEGVEGVQYAANAAVFDNGYTVPELACYCDEVRDRNCLPSGALNVSACRFGAPAFVTLPHFLYSDPYYPSKIEGLNPTEDMKFRLALEMFTGMPLSVAAQLQINLLVRHVGGMTINNQLADPDVLVPMFWFRQEVRMTPEYAAMARQALRFRYWTPYAFYALTAIGVGLLIWGVVILLKLLLRSPDTTPIMEDETNDQESN